MSHYIPVAELSELTEGQGKAVRVNNRVIALFKIAHNEVYAVENSCPHVGAPLDNGLIEDKIVTCLWHGWAFNLLDGQSTNCPGVSIKTFKTKLENGLVMVEVD